MRKQQGCKISLAAVSALAVTLILRAAAAWADPPAPGTVIPSNQATASHVDGSFNLQTSFTDLDETITGCERTVDGSNWAAATLNGGSTSTYSCTATGLTCSNGQSLTLNMRATNSLSQVGTASAISRTCDSEGPISTDNAPSGWQNSDVTVTLTASDSGSGVSNVIFCQDTSNSCTPNSYGGNPTFPLVTCPSGNVCSKYLRYRSDDQLDNLEATVHSKLIQIDKQAPTGGSISYPNGNTTSPISVTLANGTDGGGSGIGTRLLQRQQATLNGNNCAAYGSWSTIATNPTSPYSDSVAARTCNKYQYDVADNAGNHTIYTSPNVAKVK